MLNKDQKARESFKHNKNSIVSWILTASYIYYILNESILSDQVFDGMMKWLGEHYEEIEHQHKHLITKEDCENGSLFGLSLQDYPLIVRVSATQMLDKEN